jgi:chaperonin cofactor prefoldin
MLETQDLSEIISEMFSDSNFNNILEQNKKEKRLSKDIEYLEIMINTLTSEVENLSTQFNQIEDLIQDN